jgi:uncharacterized cupredoxin-like copper-binding protein
LPGGAVAVLAVSASAGARTARPAPLAATTVAVRGAEFYFKLSIRTLPRPGRVDFVFRNVGHIGHDFMIDGRRTPVIRPGKTARLMVRFTRKGSYRYRCTVPGHAAAGMKGVFIVR